MNKEEIIQTYYSGYEKKDWNVSGAVLADGFTFTSPNDDDHISKSVFKERCFLSQLDFIKQFELATILARGDEAFVRYLCETTKGTSFSNVDYFRFADGKIVAIEDYFGGETGLPRRIGLWKAVTDEPLPRVIFVFRAVCNRLGKFHCSIMLSLGIGVNVRHLLCALGHFAWTVVRGRSVV